MARVKRLVVDWAKQNSLEHMQQTTINLPSSSPVRAMTGLARALALPAEHVPQRLPSYPALERTAVIAFNQPKRLIAGNGDDGKIMLARNAAFPAWASHLGVAAEIGVVSYISNPNNIGNAAYMDYDFTPGKWQVGLTATTASADLLGIVGTGWENFALGLDKDTGSVPWFPRQVGTNNMIIITSIGGLAAVAAATVQVQLEEWVAPGQVKQTVTASATIPLGKTGVAISYPLVANSDEVVWWRPTAVAFSYAAAGACPQRMGVHFVVGATTLTYADAAATCGTVTSSGAGLRCFRPICGPAEFDVSTIPYSASRVTAVALLATNVTQVLNKNGTVVAGRLNPTVNNPFAATEDTLMSLHPAEKAWLPLETGLYTYCPPSSDLASFWDYTITETDNPSKYWPVYRLDNDSLVNCAFIQSTGVASTMALTITTHLEFRTTSALFQLALSGYTLETLHVAQLALASAGFFFENPEHKPVLNRIIAGVKRLEPFVAPMVTVAKMTPYGNAVSNVASVIKAAAKAGKPPSKVAVKAGPQKMVSTSLSAAGALLTSSKKKNKAQRKKK